MAKWLSDAMSVSLVIMRRKFLPLGLQYCVYKIAAIPNVWIRQWNNHYEGARILLYNHRLG